MRYVICDMREQRSASHRDASLGRRCRSRLKDASCRDASLQDAIWVGIFLFLPSDTFLTECKARHFAPLDFATCRNNVMNI
jgi:hypothetical protein